MVIFIAATRTREFPMGLTSPFVSRLIVLATYVAFAFVGAIVFGVF
jgi:hypothetical protein